MLFDPERYPARRPNLNGEYLYYAGWLDQSFWPDGQYLVSLKIYFSFFCFHFCYSFKIYSTNRCSPRFRFAISENIWFQCSEITSKSQFREVVLLC